jgi:hypothetical protein
MTDQENTVSMGGMQSSMQMNSSCCSSFTLNAHVVGRIEGGLDALKTVYRSIRAKRDDLHC